MSSSYLRHALVPIAVAALFTAACSTSATVEHYGKVGYAAVAKTGDAEPQKKIDPASDNTGALVGPHFAIQLAGYDVTDTVSAGDAKRYGYDKGPIAATKGNEFLLASMAKGSKVTDGAKAAVKVGSKTIKLKHVPKGNESVAVVVPKGKDATLVITDEDKSQSLNLRDGSRGSDAIAGFYNAGVKSEDPANYSEKGKANGDAGGSFLPETRTVNLKMAVDAATRSPWDEKLGWADKGKVWMIVPVSDMVTNSVWGFDTDKDSHEPILEWSLNEKELFSLTPSHGKAVKPDGKTKFTADDSRNPIDSKSGEMEFDPDSANIAFQVADDTKSATLEVKPSGTLKAKWADVRGSASWKSKPRSAKMTIEFK